VLESVVAVAGTVATRPDWIAERVEQLADGWLIEQPRAAETRRIAGTLWWSMSVYALCSAPVDALITDRPVPDPTLTKVTCGLRGDGALDAVRHAGTLDAPLGPILRVVLASLIGPVAGASGASVRSLWAIAADAIANRAVETGGGSRARIVTAVLADEIGPDLPRPRFVAVGDRTFVRRNSCCLYYFSPLAADKCTSCPRRTPDERRALLAALGPMPLS